MLAVLPLLAVMVACAALAHDPQLGLEPDLLLYSRAGEAIAGGGLPYRDFRFEYPPLAAVPMALPHLLWPGGLPGLLHDQWLWAIGMGLAASAVGVLVGWIAARPGSVVTPWRAMLGWALVAIVETPVVAWRFDIVAVALALAGVALVLAARPGLAGVVLAIGAFVKIYPVVLVPVLLVWLVARRDATRALRLAVSFATSAVVILALVAAIVGLEPTLQFVRYQQDRLVQVESLMSSLALVGHLVADVPVSIAYGFQSVQLRAPGLGPALALATPILAVVVGAVVAYVALRLLSERSERSGPRLSTLIAALTATVLALLLANKVFSAQYVLWVLPFACLLPRRQFAIALAATVLSVLVFPLGYKELVELQPQAILTLAARNGLLVILLGWLLVELRPLGGLARYRAALVSPPQSERTSYTR